jgi:hypothetical protein
MVNKKRRLFDEPGPATWQLAHRSKTRLRLKTTLISAKGAQIFTRF